jgi:hypothetical protein
MSQLLHYAAMPTRLEPLSATKEHRCLASGGNAHGVALWVRLAGASGSRLYRLDIGERRLIAAAGARALDKGGAQAVEVIPVAHMQAVIKGYGEFGLCLLLLEAGMMQLQLATLAAHLGLAPQLAAGTASAQFRSEAGADDGGSIVLPGIRIDLAAPWPVADVQQIAHVALPDPPQQGDRPLLGRMLGAIQTALDGPAAWRAAGTPWPGPGLARPFAATVARSSGDAAHDQGGRLAEDDMMALIDAGHAHACAIDPAGRLADLSLHLAVRTSGAGLRLWERAPVGPWRQTTPRGAAAGLEGDVDAILTLHADDGFARDGDAGRFARAFLAAGQIVQGVCLAGPQFGAFVRPHKAIADAIVNAQLPLAQRALVQLHIGAIAVPPLRFPLI